PDRLHLFRFAGGEIGQGSMLDLAIFAIRLAQKVAGVGLAVEAGDRAVDEHYGYICKPNRRSLQEKCATISGYISNAQIAPNLLISIHKLSMSERRKGGTSDPKYRPRFCSAERSVSPASGTRGTNDARVLEQGRVHHRRGARPGARRGARFRTRR